MGDGSKNDYLGWKVATKGKLADLTFNGENVIDEKKFLSEPLGIGSLGGVTKMNFAEVVESGKTVVTFSTENNMEVHGDLEVQGDLNVDGGLVVHGEITADFVHTGQEEEADEEPAEDEVFLTPQELKCIDTALHIANDPWHMSQALGVASDEAVAIMNSVREKLID